MAVLYRILFLFVRCNKVSYLLQRRLRKVTAKPKLLNIILLMWELFSCIFLVRFFELNFCGMNFLLGTYSLINVPEAKVFICLVRADFYNYIIFFFLKHFPVTIVLTKYLNTKHSCISFQLKRSL